MVGELWHIAHKPADFALGVTAYWAQKYHAQAQSHHKAQVW